MRIRFIHILFYLVILFSCKPSEVEKITDDTYEINAPIYYGEAILPKNNPLTNSGITLGRHLFYEKALSIDSTISCGSCHIQKFGFSDTTRFSNGVNGGKTSRKSMGLSNLTWQTHFFWDGRSNSLENQAIFPIEDVNEMGLSRFDAVDRLNKNPFYQNLCLDAFGTKNFTPELISKALAQFERTMISSHSKYDKYKQGLGSLTESELKGEALFFTHPVPSIDIRGGNCGDCHTGALTTNNDFSNNGLDANPFDIGLQKLTSLESDKGKFKIVSLRNVALHPPFMHDGRFNTLREVLDHYNEHIQQSNTLDPQIIEASNTINGTKLDLSEQEKTDIINFLHTLSDEEFINNEDLSNPFE